MLRFRAFVPCSLALAGALACSTDPTIMGNGPPGSDTTGTGMGTGNGMMGTGTGSGNSTGSGQPSMGMIPGFTLPPPSTDPPPTPVATPETNCGVEKFPIERVPAELLLVLDRSGSMENGLTNERQAPAGMTRWDVALTALDKVIMQTQGGVIWGLKMYPVGGECGVMDGAEVAPNINNYMGMLSSIRMNAPGGGTTGRTPTRIAMEKAVAYLKTRTTMNPKYVLLATDGQPNCAPAMAGQRGNGDDVMGAVASVDAAAKAGFKTFVVGIATAGTAAHDTLNQMADKGLMPRMDPMVRYYSAVSQQELSTALEAIAGQVGSCTFKLGRKPPSPNDVAVDVDGKRVMRDPTHTNGWDYTGDDYTSIVFYGSSCEQLKTAAISISSVQFIFGCANQPIP